MKAKIYITDGGTFLKEYTCETADESGDHSTIELTNAVDNNGRKFLKVLIPKCMVVAEFIEEAKEVKK